MVTPPNQVSCKVIEQPRVKGQNTYFPLSKLRSGGRQRPGFFAPPQKKTLRVLYYCGEDKGLAEVRSRANKNI